MYVVGDDLQPAEVVQDKGGEPVLPYGILRVVDYAISAIQDRIGGLVRARMCWIPRHLLMTAFFFGLRVYG